MRHRRIAVAAVLAGALLPGAASAAPRPPGTVWGLAVGMTTAHDYTAARLTASKASGVTTLIVDRAVTGAARRRLDAAAKAAGVDVLAPLDLDRRRRRGGALGAAVRSACRAAVRRDAVCAVRTARRSVAIAAARTRRAGLVVLRLRSPADVPALARDVRRGRVLAVVDLIDGGAPAATWRHALAAASGSGHLDLAVRPRGDRRQRALARYLTQLAEVRPGRSRPFPGPTPGTTAPLPPVPPPADAVLWIDDTGGSCERRPVPGPWVDATACGSFAEALSRAQPGDTVLVRCVTPFTCSFPPETLTGDRGASAPVTFAAAPAFTVGFEEPTGSGRSVWLNELRNVVFRDLGFGQNNTDDAQPNLRIDCTRSVTLVNAHGRRFYMFEGNAHVTFLGGDWGGYASPGEEDSTMGTTGAHGPQHTCAGDSAPEPQTDITFDGVRFHDVFDITCSGPVGSCPEWGGSHPDCFEINGYVNGVTIQNSIFEHCGNTMLSLYTDQGDIKNVVARNNTFRDVSPNSYFGIQWVRGGATPPNTYFCDDSAFLDNIYTPGAANGWLAYTPPRFACDSHGGHGIRVDGNVIQRGAGAPECATSKAAPYYTRWGTNVFVLGDACQ